MEILKLVCEEGEYDIEEEIVEKYNIKPGDISPFTGLKVVSAGKISKEELANMELVVEEFDRSLIKDIDIEENKAEVIDIILEDRIDMINKNIEIGNIDFGYTFILKDLFYPEDWEYLSDKVGNWQLGRGFSSKINTGEYPIERIENDSQGYAQYMIRTD